MAELIYLYDGSFDGFLCCVFESYVNKEIPITITGDGEATLFETREIKTNREHAARVYRSLVKHSAGQLLRYGFLTALENKEDCLYRFIRKLFQRGAPLLRDLTDEAYCPVWKAIRQMTGEAQLLRGFVRFSEFSGVLGAEITPKNRVLPLLRPHFCERYRDERFFLYDKTHREALFYAAGKAKIVPLDAFTMAQPDELEANYRLLWKRFYDTIAIRERANPKCRMSHMPKRYWGNMTEFQPDSFFKSSPADEQVPCAPNGISAPATPPESAPSAPASGS